MRILIPSALMFLYVLPALACAPFATPPTLESQIKGADVIFEGRVIEIAKPATITFEVKRYWKGSPDQKIIVQTVDNTCGISGATPGDVMIIFAKGNPLMTMSTDGDFIIETALGHKIRDTKRIEDALGKGHSF